MKNKITVGVALIAVLLLVTVFTNSRNDTKSELVLVSQSDKMVIIADSLGQSHTIDLTSRITRPDESLGELGGEIQETLIDTQRNAVYILYRITGIPGRNAPPSEIARYLLPQEKLENLKYNGVVVDVDNPSNLHISEDRKYLIIDYSMSNGGCELVNGRFIWNLDMPDSSATSTQQIEQVGEC